MVKREPNIIRGWVAISFWLCYILFGLLNTFFTPNALHESWFIALFPYGFIGLTNVILAIAREILWRKQDQRRQRAARGDQSLVADPQPVPTTNLILPLTIIQRTAKMWTIVMIVMGIVFLTLVTSFVYSLIQDPSYNRDTSVTFFSLLLLALFIIFIVTPIVRGYQWLTIDKDGVSVRVGFGRVHHINWDEAQLFAASSLYQPNTSMRQFPSFYELSNAKKVVRWRWVRTRSFVAIEPMLPIDEYDRQMKAVLSLVVGKTGLMLHDVRPNNEK